MNCEDQELARDSSNQSGSEIKDATTPLTRSTFPRKLIPKRLIVAKATAKGPNGTIKGANGKRGRRNRHVITHVSSVENQNLRQSDGTSMGKEGISNDNQQQLQQIMTLSQPDQNEPILSDYSQQRRPVQFSTNVS